MIELNYNEKNKKHQIFFKHVEKRILTPIGKITVIKTLLISTLNHLFILLHDPPQNFISSINKILYTFIWNGPNRIKEYFM